MKFTSELYPQLRVYSLGVKFVDGVAEVTDQKAIDALKKMSDLGIKAQAGRPTKKDSAAEPPVEPEE